MVVRAVKHINLHLIENHVNYPHHCLHPVLCFLRMNSCHHTCHRHASWQLKKVDNSPLPGTMHKISTIILQLVGPRIFC